MALLEISDEQINAQFEKLHAADSPLRAIAEAKRPNSADDFNVENAIERFENNVDFYADMFGSAVNLMVETSRKDNDLK